MSVCSIKKGNMCFLFSHQFSIVPTLTESVECINNELDAGTHVVPATLETKIELGPEV